MTTNDKDTHLFYPAERLSLFVDGAAVFSCAKQLQYEVDFKRVLRFFAAKGTLVRSNYYTVVSDSEEFDPLRPLVDYLSYNGWSVTAKRGAEYQDSLGRKKFRGTIMPDLIVDMLDASTYMDHIVLFSGDGSLRPVLHSLQRRGKRVTVVSTIKTTPPVCADDLRRQADNFVDMENLREFISKPTRPGVPGLMPLEAAR